MTIFSYESFLFYTAVSQWISVNEDLLNIALRIRGDRLLEDSRTHSCNSRLFELFNHVALFNTLVIRGSAVCFHEQKS